MCLYSNAYRNTTKRYQTEGTQDEARQKVGCWSRSCLNTYGARAPPRVHLRSGPGPATFTTSNLFPSRGLEPLPNKTAHATLKTDSPPVHPAGIQDDADTSSTQPELTINRGRRPGQVRQPKQAAPGLRKKPSGKRVPFRPRLSSVEVSSFCGPLSVMLRSEPGRSGRLTHSR